MAKKYELEFKACKVEDKWDSLPVSSGVYCVFAGTISKGTGKLKWPRLLYIGEAEDVRKRVPEDPSDRWEKWKKELKGDEVLCVSYALIEPASDRERAEAAMINQHKPPCNKTYKFRFPFPETTIVTSGNNAKLEKEFTVKRH